LGGKVQKGITVSTEFKKQTQITGFISCLQALLSRYRLTLCKDYYNQYFQRKFKDVELSQMPKLFKLSLATHFSKVMNQELPEDHSKSIDLFPQGKLRRLIHKATSTKSKKVKFYWDLLQCKDLASKVPKEMIQAAYEKHQKILSSVGESPENVLTMIRDYFRDFCEVVKKEFKEISPLPPKSAYLNSKKSEGGCLNYFKNKNLITSHIFERRSISDDTWRIDPVVIHITGKPNVGKSYLVDQICKKICGRFGLNDKTSVYQRSIATDHWDGYRNQLITVIDDAFSDQDGIEDQKQIIQICSNVPTVLPMADLKEKGRMFTSDFLIITSNYPEKSLGWKNTCVNNTDAFLRRIYPAYKINRFNSDKKTYSIEEIVLEQDGFKTKVKRNLELNTFDFLSQIVDDSLSTFRKRARYNDFVVPVTRNGPFEPNLGFRIPISPPNRLPVVKAHAIPEALKVRMITKAEEECWVLKPVQKAMWKALQHFKCFELTGTPNIDLEFINSWKGKYLLSGDYESATDNLHQDIMNLAIQELKKVIPEPYSSWMEFESQPHLVEYPEHTGLENIIQTRGQLMGSLLSFPILCVANAACIGIIKKQDLSELQALINGDDILFRECGRKIQSWKRLTKSIGLKPSIGKNYCAEDFGSINSQLLFFKNGKAEHLATGCFGAISKVKNFLSNFQYALKMEPERESDFKHTAKKLLSKTPESLDVPVSHGGIGLEFRKSRFDLRNKEIYFFKFLNKKCHIIQEIDDDLLVRLPTLLLKKFGKVLDPKYMKEIPDIEIEEDQSDLNIFPWKKFNSFCKWYKTIPNLRSRIVNSNLQQEIPLNLVKTRVVRLNRSYQSLIKNLHLHI